MTKELGVCIETTEDDALKMVVVIDNLGSKR
jgi:hypothetical protein